MSTTIAATMAKERLSPKILFWSTTAALAGFLFGFDTVVISGAEQKIQASWGLSPGAHGIAMASTLYGTVVGALMGAWPTDRFGRKATLMIIGVIYLVSAVWSALATDVYSFSAARMMGGLGIGIATVAAPLYNTEIAPPKHRGLLAGMFQFNIVFGIVVAYASNAMLSTLEESAWRWMLGVAAFPSLLYILCCLWIRESPRWLIGKKNDHAAAIAVLGEIYPEESEAALCARAAAIAGYSHDKRPTARFWTRELKTPILLAFLVAFFNQMSGINAVLYFAPRIFELAELGQQAALLQSVGIGITFMIFTMLGVWAIDRVGRRTLLYVGTYGYIFSLAVVAWGFFTENFQVIPVSIFCFIAAHGIGQGTVIWVLISEVFPDQHRAAGQALGSFTHWVFAALITTLFPKFITIFPPGSIFLFFCGMTVLQLLWVKTMVVETKGVPLEVLQQTLRGR